jgi:two-component system response regulator TctD
MRCLLIEDDADLATWLVTSLAGRSIFAEWEESGILGLRRGMAEEYDAIILDLGLPGLNGAEVLSRIRALGGVTPILVVTARDDLSERVALLHGGADDFLTKPFALDELEARLVALVRRSHGRATGNFACGSLTYEQATQQFRLADMPMALSPREHAVLRLLIMRHGEPLSKSYILDRLIGEEGSMNLETVEVMIYRLRRKLEGSDMRIVTMRGLGYLLETDAPE